MVVSHCWLCVAFRDCKTKATQLHSPGLVLVFQINVYSPDPTITDSTNSSFDKRILLRLARLGGEINSATTIASLSGDSTG
jgi:hypothetical protein